MQNSILDASEEAGAVSPVISIEYPSLLTRVKSTIIDAIFVLIVFVITSSVLSSMDHPPVWLKIFIFFTMLVGYEPLLTAAGCTLGQLVMGIRVRRIDNPSQKINIFFSIFRYIVKGLLGWLSLLAISFTNNKRAIHDMASGSIVVYKKMAGE